MDVLSQAWGDKRGFVCLSTKNESTPFTNHFFKWPAEKDRILPFIRQKDAAGLNVWWSFNVYKIKSRKMEDIVLPINVIGLDCDYAVPSTFPIPPACFWETSPHRYHAIWFNDEGMDLELARRTSQGLSTSTFADRGGHDPSHVLRVPGTHNYKYPGVVVSELAGENKDEDTGRYARVCLSPCAQSVDKQRGSGVVKHLYDKYRVSRSLRRLHDHPAGDRSDALWAMESECKRIGMSKEEAFMFAWSSINNKFAERDKDRERGGAQIWKEIEKVWKEAGAPSIVTAVAASVCLTPLTANPSPAGKEWTSFTSLMCRSHEKPLWMIENLWMQGSHGILAGEPKTYKSVISTEIAVSVATGIPCMGIHEVKQTGDVLIIQEENDPATVQDRIHKVMGKKGLLGDITFGEHSIDVNLPSLDWGIHCRNNLGFDLTNTGGRMMLEQAIANTRPVLVILDPLYLMLGGVDENNSSEVRGILQWLMQIRYAYGCSIMVIHHFKKAESSRGGQRMLGTTTFHAWAESGLYTRFREDGIELEREFRIFKRCNLFLTMQMGDPGDMLYEMNCSESKGNAEDRAIELLAEAGEEGMEYEELCRKVPLKDAAARKIIRDMAPQVEVCGVGKDKRVYLRR